MTLRWTIRHSLVAVCMLFGVAPAFVISWIAYRSASESSEHIARSFESFAQQTADKIDRNLFERYGDVQAFGLNKVVQNRDEWAKGSKSAIVDSMNAYVDTYDLYYVTMLVDPSGRLIAVNTKDSDGKPVETQGLYAANYAEEPWFKDALAGKFLESKDHALTGTVVGDVEVSPLVKSLFNNEGLAIPFTAPVKDESGRTIAVWHNLAKFSLVEEIIRSTYAGFKDIGISSAEITLLHRDGRVLVDYDPAAAGTTDVRHDMNVIGRLNLVQAGLPAAVKLASGEAGAFSEMKHARKGIMQTAGFAPCQGALGFPGLPWGVMVRASTGEALAGVYATHRAVMVAMGVSTLAVAVLSFFFAGRLVAPINGFVRRLRDIAEGEGDLTQRVDEARRDELGELGRWFNAFIGNVQQIVGDVTRSAGQVSAAATEIAASSEEMAAGLKTQEQQVAETSSHIEQLAASVSQVASRCDEAAAAAEHSGKDASTGGEVVTSTISEMKAISADVAGAAQGVEHLGKKSEEIGQIIGVINDIADQTNLLALNAAIEAARAGEHGRGFAVVADEVRKLAERTTKATEEVARSIREIQAETQSAVTKITAGASRVNRGVELANKAGEALSRIVSGAGGLNGMIRDIASATQEQSSASTAMTQSVARVRSVAGESNEGALQAAQAAMLLSKEAENLQALVKRFKTA